MRIKGGYIICRIFFLNCLFFNPRGHEEKKFHEGMRGGGDQSDPPSIFNNLQPIDIKLGMCKKCPVCLQLSIVTWYLISFHGNHSNKITSLVAAILDFQIFKFFSNSNLNTENSDKTTLSDSNLQNCKIHCKVVVINTQVT